METKLQKSYEDPDKKTIYNYYHDYFTAKKKVRMYPTGTDYLKIKSPRYSADVHDTGEEYKIHMNYQTVDQYILVNGTKAEVRHDFQSI